MLKKDNKQNHYLILLFIQIIFLVYVQSSAFAVEPQIQLDRQYYMTGSTVHITITDATANTDASGREIINVNVKSSADTSGISVDLLETGVSTSVFEGSLLLASDPSDDGSDKLQVNNGDTITVTYNGSYTADAALDDIPPEYTSGNPTNDALGVDPAITTIIAVFDESVQWSSNSGNISIVDHYNNHINIKSSVINNSTMELTLYSYSLAFGETYTVTIPAGAVEDGAGNPNLTVTWNFTTVSMELDKTVYKPRDTVTVTLYDLAKGSGSVTVKAKSNNYTSNPVFVNLSGSGGVFTGSFTLSGPAGNSDDNNDILGVTAFYDGLTVSYYPDNDGIYELNTTANVDAASPTVSFSSPQDNETGVAVNTPVTITFNENIKQGNQFNFIDIGYNDGSGWQSAGGITTGISGNTLTINHNNLAHSTEYQVLVYTDSIRDMAGNFYNTDNSIVLTFTTQTVSNRDIHVAINGNNINGDGSQLKPYGTIVKAIETANDGDTVIVHDGTYDENVVVTKDINIISVNGPEVTTVQTGSQYAFKIQPVQGSYGTRRITGFNITGAQFGIYLSGMADGLAYIENNLISGCKNYGIFIDNHSGGTVYIRKNTISSNTGTGINLETSADGHFIKVKWNNILSNSYKGIVNKGTNQLDASLNYWGNPHGPTHDSINYGNGVSGNINFQPWLVNEYTGTEVNTEISVTTPILSDAYSGLEYYDSLPVQTNTTDIKWSLYSGFLPGGLNIFGGKALYGEPTTTGSYNFAMEAADGVQAVYNDVSLKVVANYTGPGPAVVSRTPAPYESTTAVVTPVKIIFNEAIQLAANSAGYINILNTADPYDSPVINRSIATTGIADDTLVIDHFNFRPDTLYKVSLSNNAVMDMDGNGFNTEWYFTTSSQVPALEITTTSMQDGTEGNPYSLTLKASGGVGNYIWRLAAGSSLPDGLNLSPEGIISGTPTTAGSYTFTVQVADQASTTDAKLLAITINSPADTTPPAVVQKTPGDNSTGVLINAAVTVQFDESIQEGGSFTGISITPQEGTVVTGGGSINGNIITISHADFTDNTAYTVTVPANAVKDMAGNTIPTEITWNFTTGGASDAAAPVVIITQPANFSLFNGPVSIEGTVHEDNLKEVEVTIKSVNANKYWDGAGGTWASNETWNVAQYSGFAPGHSFQYPAPGKSQNAPEGAYTAGVRAKDYSGNVSSTATVNYSLDLTQPDILNSNPALVAYNVPIDSLITLTYNEDVTKGNLALITFNNAGTNKAVTFQAAFDEQTNTLVITHPDLEYDTNYEIFIDGGVVKDPAGNNNVEKFFTFSTAENSSGGDTTPEITVIFEDDDADGIYHYYYDGTGDTLTFSLSGLPERLTLSAQFGALDENGTFTVTGAVENGWITGEESAAYPGVYLFSVDIATPNKNNNLPLALELDGLPEGTTIPPFLLKDITTDPSNPRTAMVNIASPGTVTAGDIDDSKAIDLADAILALKVVADMNPNGIYPYADVNGDGRIGLEEVVYILQKTAAP